MKQKNTAAASSNFITNKSLVYGWTGWGTGGKVYDFHFMFII